MRSNQISLLPQQRLLSLKDAAPIMGRSVWGMRELIWSGKVPYIQDGKKIYVDIRDLEDYIERHKTREVS
jgi:hypothetical protein